MKALVPFFLLTSLIISCSEDNDDNKAPETLSAEQLEFIEEYEYVTFNFSPTSSGGSVNEKWIGEVPIFLDGNISGAYRQIVMDELSELNGYFTDGANLVLADNLEDALVHLYLGNEDEIENLWPDMYSLISAGQFQGYALYGAGSGQILNGRIWVKNDGMPIFRHELGHILGFGHASDPYCDNDGPEERSYMCSSLAQEYSIFDRAMIRTLYHSDILPGVPFGALRPEIENLLLSGEISF